MLRPDAEFVAPVSAAEAASVIAAGTAAGHDAIVVAGGDGTVNLALNVIMDPATDRPRAPRVALGAIGLGSSNDFHKPIAPERDLAGAPARVDVEGATVVDVGKATIQLPGEGRLVRYFLLNASMGMVADGNNAFNTSRGLVKLDQVAQRGLGHCGVRRPSGGGAAPTACNGQFARLGPRRTGRQCRGAQIGVLRRRHALRHRGRP